MTNEELNRSYLDKLDTSDGGFCPGFYLWDVLASDGKRYLIAADYPGAVEVRLYFRARLDVVSATKLGPNPDAAAWQAVKG
jgi:hypothetical protein